MIVPAPLSRGDVVRVIAPAGPFDPDRFQAGLEVLVRRLGLSPRMREDVGAAAGYLAGDDGRRLAEWDEAVADPEARAIWCARGGYGSMRLLPRVDPAPLLARPRWLVGFSDVTALHLALNQAGLATLHAPLVVTLPQLPPAALDHLEALLSGRAGPGVELPGTATVRSGRAEGPLLGGTLALLAHLCGTPWQPRLSGAILFLEDVGEKPYQLDRYLTQLRLAGALDGLAGVALGQFNGGEESEAAMEAVRALVRALGVPAIEGLSAGHLPANLAFPLGPRATLLAPGPGGAGGPRLVLDAGSARERA